MVRSAFKVIACVGLGCFPAGFLSAEDTKGEKEREKEKGPPADRPPLRDLLTWNADAIFGGKLNLEGEDRFEVTFDKAGQMARGFEGQAIMDEKSPGAQGSNRKFYTKDKDKVIDNLAAIGISPPSSVWTYWTSRFPVAGDVRVKLDFRIPNLLTQESGFVARVNWTKNTWLETQFFSSVTKQAFGKAIAAARTGLKEYAGPASRWFPRKGGKEVPVEISTEGGKLKVNFAGKDLVTLDKVADVPRGKVVFGFRKIVFTIQNLKVSGVLDKEWCEAEISRLAKAGKLIQKPPPAEGTVTEAPSPEAPAEKKKKEEEEKKKASKEKEAEGDL